MAIIPITDKVLFWDPTNPINKIAMANANNSDTAYTMQDIINTVSYSGGSIDGSGTATFLPKFIDTNTIGDSIISDDGTDIKIPGFILHDEPATNTKFGFYSNDGFRVYTDGNIMIEADQASVLLKEAGAEKFRTTATGISVTGALSTTTNVIVGANATFVDNGKALFGASSDLQVYHDGSNSYVRDVGTGRLWIDSNGEGVSIISDGSGATPMAHFYKDAAVELYYNNVKRLETVTAGAKVTGNLEVTGGILDSNGNLGTAGQVLSSTGTALDWIDCAGGSAVETTVTVSNAQLLAMDSTNVSIIAAPGANKYIKILAVSCFLDYTAPAFTVNTMSSASLSVNAVNYCTLPMAGLFNASADTVFQIILNGAGVIAENTALELKSPSAVTSGGSTMQIKVKYQILDTTAF